MGIDGMKHRKRGRSASGLLARLFVERLEKGIMIDRTHVHADGKARKKIAAPVALRKFG